MSTIRLLTSNIQAGRSADGRRTSAGELAAAYDGVHADVVALQEVDRDQHRSGRLDQLPVIAEALGLEHARFGAAIGGDLRLGREPAASIGAHDGPAYGVALASRYPVISWFTCRLPRTASQLPIWQRGRLGWWVHEPRVAVVAVLDGPDGPFAAATTHLSLLNPIASWQLRILIRRVAALNLPAVVAGDFNLRYPIVRRVANGWQLPSEATFPADEPTRQIDHILVRGGTVSNVAAMRLPISDHRALAADVSWA